jgi:NRAMP (natural resistance-associated macrophage protein)-like metal ion transporter
VISDHIHNHGESIAPRSGHAPPHSTSSPRRPHSVQDFFRQLGPGLIAGAADDDPTGIATYAQAGARTGYALLWTCLLTIPMMVAVQYMAAKVAVVHQDGLSGVIREHYSRPVLYGAVLALMIANVINAGADLGALAAAVNLILPVAAWVLVLPITLLILGFLVLGSFRLIENTFKWLTLALLAYIGAAFLAHPAFSELIRGTFIPTIHVNSEFLVLLLAALGGNVSPYLFFWQADLEVAGQRTRRVRHVSRLALTADLRRVAWDTTTGMIFSNIIIYFIEVATAATLFAVGQRDVTSAAQAAEALRPLLGNGATLLWAIGMIGSGLLAVPALTGSVADAIASTFGWRHGLDQKFARARRFYLILAVAMGLAMLINFLGINPIRALVLAGAINGVITPLLLVLLIRVANAPEVMGDRVNGRWLNLAAWATAAIMSVAATTLLVSVV